jgi:hypothetical protein
MDKSKPRKSGPKELWNGDISTIAWKSAQQKIWTKIDMTSTEYTIANRRLLNVRKNELQNLLAQDLSRY